MKWSSSVCYLLAFFLWLWSLLFNCLRWELWILYDLYSCKRRDYFLEQWFSKYDAWDCFFFLFLITFMSQYGIWSHILFKVCVKIDLRYNYDCQNIYIFRSPEPKAQVRYCHPFSSILRRLSCIDILHFQLLLQNRCADFNQTCLGSLGRGPKVSARVIKPWYLYNEPVTTYSVC